MTLPPPSTTGTLKGASQVIATIEYRGCGRVRSVHFGDLIRSFLEKLATMMMEEPFPFPMLTYVWLQASDEIDESALVLPESFFCGSAAQRHQTF